MTHRTSPHAGLPVAVYTRASDDTRGTFKSVKGQEAEGRDWIRRNQAHLFDVYCDNDVSASAFSKKAREEYDRLLGDVDAGRVKIIWFWKLSRQARKLSVFADLRDRSRRQGVLWVVEGRIYDLNHSGDRWALGIQAIEAEELPETISSNVRLGHKLNADAGRPHGPKPHGYDRIYDERTKRLVAVRINEAEAAIIRGAAELVASGGTLRAYVADLNRRGFRTRNGLPWSVVTLRQILKNPIYIGKRTHLGRVVADAVWPAILDEKTFYDCQKVFAGRVNEHSTAVKHLVSGLAVARCGGILRAETVGGIQKYVCRRNGCMTIRKDQLEDYVQDYLLTLLESPDVRARLVPASQEQDARAAAAEASRLSVLLDEWAAAAKRGDIGPDEYMQVTGGLKKALAEAERASTVGLHPAISAALRPDIRVAWWDEGLFPLTRKRDVIRSLLAIRVNPPLGRNRWRVFDPSWVQITVKDL